MVLSSADKAVIEACFKEKGWRGARIVREFPGKNWNYKTVNRLIQKLQKTGSVKRLQGSGRPRTVSTDENAQLVDDLLCSQDDQPGSHLSQRKISNRLNIPRSSAQRIIKNKHNVHFFYLNSKIKRF